MAKPRQELPQVQDENVVLATKTKHALDLDGAPSTILAGVLWQTGVPAGVAQLDSCSVPINLHLRMPEGARLGTSLQELSALNPDYKWEVRGRVVNLLPVRGVPDLLKARVAAYESDSGANNRFAPSAVLLDLVALSGIRARAAQLKLKPGLYTGGPSVACDTSINTDCSQHPTPPVRISIKNASLLEAFNSTVIAYGHTIWTYAETECNGQKTYSVSTQPD